MASLGSHASSLALRLISMCCLFALRSTHAQLLRDRSVKCRSDSMEVTFEFSAPFDGIVYANEHYQDEDCRWSGSGSRRVVANVPLSTQSSNKPYCGVSVHETSGEFSVMLIVTPMKGLLVEGMSGLQVRCQYNIGDVTLTLPAGPNGAGIFISPQTQAGVVTGSGGSPFLLMAIREGHGINGEVIQSASVGERITLDVVMQDTTIYDFYVHDCYAHDGTNTPEASISIIDNSGCAVRLSRAVDVPVFTTPPVSGGAKHVYVHMYGFQFTTSQLVYFECQVRPCLQSCGRSQCEATAKRQKRQLQSAQTALNNSIAGARQLDDENDYRLQFKLYIDPQRSENIVPARDDPLPSVAHADVAGVDTHRICVNVQVGIAILIIFLLVCAVSLALTAYMCYRAQHDADKQTNYPRFNYYTPSSTPSQRTAMHSPSTSSYSAPDNPRATKAATATSSVAHHHDVIQRHPTRAF